MTYQTISVVRDGSVERVTLNRPEVRNAFNPALIEELTAWAERATRDGSIRAAVLGGAGKAFSAGADLDWMAESADYTRERNVQDARRLAAMFEALDHVPMPLVGRVHGAALGGGAGLVAVCDIVVADETSTFGFTETRLGLVPAVISPYVVTKIGVSAARELFLTGARFAASRAREIGLVHHLASAARLDADIDDCVRQVLAGGPEAIRAAKALLREVAPGDRRPSLRAAITALTADVIADRRASSEGQEGMRAFLEKRKPKWMV